MDHALSRFEFMLSHRQFREAAQLLTEQPFTSPPPEWTTRSYFLMALHPKIDVRGVGVLFDALIEKGFPQDNPTFVAQALAFVLRRAPSKATLLKKLVPALLHHAHRVEPDTAVEVLYLASDLPEIVHALVAHGLDIDSVNKKGDTALTTVLKERAHLPLENVVALLDGGANPNGAVKSRPPLLYTYDLSTVDLLLIRGADPNAHDISGNTPLMHWANLFRMGTPDFETARAALRHLVDHGADMHARTGSGETVFDLHQGEPVEKVLRELEAIQQERVLQGTTAQPASGASRPRF